MFPAAGLPSAAARREPPGHADSAGGREKSVLTCQESSVCLGGDFLVAKPPANYRQSSASSAARAQSPREYHPPQIRSSRSVRGLSMALCPAHLVGQPRLCPLPVCDRSQAAAMGRLIAPPCTHPAAVAQPDVIGAGVTSCDGRGLFTGSVSRQEEREEENRIRRETAPSLSAVSIIRTIETISAPRPPSDSPLPPPPPQQASSAVAEGQHVRSVGFVRL